MKFSFPVKIYLLALVLRLIPVFLTMNMGIGLDDMFQYDMLARNLASGHGFRWYALEDLKRLEPYVSLDLSTASDYDPRYGVYTSFRAPLYPTFLAFIYSLSGLGFSRFFAARCAQAILLGAPLAPLTYGIAKRFFVDIDSNEKISRLAASIVACYPMLLVYPLGLGTENLFFILLLFSFLFLLRTLAAPSKLNFLFAGVFLGLAALTRSVVLPFVGVSLFYLFYLHRTKVWITFVAFCLIISPWMIRNSLLHHKLTGIETSMGYNLYLGYYPEGNGSFIFGPSLDLLPIMDDSERDAIGTEKALEFIRAEPGRFIPLALNRLGFFFGLENRVLMYFYSNNLLGYISTPTLLLISAFFLLPFVFVSILAVFGLVVQKPSQPRALLHLLLFAYIMPYVLILSEDRFHLALIPFLAMLASYTFVLLKERRYVHYVSIRILALAGILIILLVLNWGLELHRDADKIAAILQPNGNQLYLPY